MTATKNSHTTNNLDLMRLGFASMVLLSHSSELIYGDRSHEPLTQLFHTISFGELGVDCFFILSGFMIASSWERDPRLVSFLKKRVLRIYPAFIVAYLLSVLVVGAIGAADANVYLHGLDPVLMIQELANLKQPSTPPTFLESHYSAVNGSLWTIHYEFNCYLAMLAVGWAGLLLSARKITALWLITLVAFVIFRARHGDEFGAVMGGHVRSLLRLLPLFLSGAVIYKTEIWRLRSPRLIVLAAIVLVAGLSNTVTAELSVATAGAYLLFIVGFTPIQYSAARRMPDVSYGVYLYGWPVQKLLILWLPSAAFPIIFLLSTICCVGLGFISWFSIEKPALSLRRITWPISVGRLHDGVAQPATSLDATGDARR